MNERDIQALSYPEQKEIELISLLRQAGFSRCRLGKFDEYELFDQNRAFLEGDKMLTFTDPYGKLYALRPDTTLSVMKQAACQPENAFRVYYREDVFRLSAETHQYEAHCQIGAEAIEKQRQDNGCEMLSLAQKALALLGEKTVLVLSHMGFLLENQWYIQQKQTVKEQILLYIGQKNRHDLADYLQAASCPEEEKRKLTAATALTGNPEAVWQQVRQEGLGQELESAAKEICEQAAQLAPAAGQSVIADLSLVNPLSYYNGLVFQGFVEGCSSYVMSGGRYDRLAMQFMPEHQNTCGAIGFAVDLEALEPVLRKKEAGLC